MSSPIEVDMITARLVAILCVCTTLAGCGSQPSLDRSAEPAVATESTGKTTKSRLQAALSLVYRALKPGEIVLLELYSDKIVFTALISRRKFEK